MKTVVKRTLPLLLLAALFPLRAAPGDDAPADPLVGAFFPPEAVIMAHAQIGLSEDQIAAVKALVGKEQSSVEELQQKLKREVASLAALAKPDRVDEAQLAVQLDKVLDVERELKHQHLSLLASIKNVLTPGQLAKLRELMKDGGAKLGEETRERLTGKVAKVKAGIEKWLAAKRDPSAIAQAMQTEFKPLIDAGQVSEAEAVLDRLLAQLDAGTK